MTYTGQAFRSRPDRTPVVRAHQLTAINDALVAHEAAWTASTPGFLNVTIGNGTSTGRWRQVGKTVNYEGTVTAGSTTSITGNIVVSLPVTPRASWKQLGVCTFVDASAVTEQGGWCRIGTSGLFTFLDQANATADATNPFTWADGDSLTWAITYEAA